MLEKIRTEPVVFSGLLETAFVTLAGLALVLEWGSPEAWGAAQLVFAALMAIAIFFVRGSVSPVPPTENPGEEV